MKSWRTWRPLGDADLAAARAAAAQTLADWNQAWFGLDACQVQHACIAPLQATVAASEKSFRLGEALGCSGSTMGLRSLVALSLRGRADPWPDDPVALNALEGFRRRLIEDLLRRMARSLGQPEGLQLREGLPRESASQAFLVEVGMAGRGTALVLSVDPVAVHATPRRSGMAKRPLSGRWDALAASRTRLQASIGPISLGALELMQLKPGDVLQAERSIYEPIDVRAGDVSLGRAYPCRVEQRLALQFSLDKQDGRDDGKR
jgi:flagellar motor switch/type III secretory pathway protein FliN